MSDGIWHTTIPITDEHVFLHLLRAVYFHFHGYENELKGCQRDYNAPLFARTLIEWGRLPSPYLNVYKQHAWFKFPQWRVEPTELGLYYSDYVYTYVDRLDCEIISFFYKRKENGRMGEKIPHAAARFRERLPIILQNYGFSSRADYLVKWSIFKGALGSHAAPLELGKHLNIFDSLSEGIPSRKEADKTVCIPVEELL